LGGGATVRQFDRLAPDIPNFFMHEPLEAPLNELGLFIAKNHRPPTDIEELAAFAKDDPGFDRSKFSELRLEFPSDEAVAIAWRLASPLHGAGTNTLLNWRR
jgi:hypothetical protein